MYQVLCLALSVGRAVFLGTQRGLRVFLFPFGLLESKLLDFYYFSPLISPSNSASKTNPFVSGM